MASVSKRKRTYKGKTQITWTVRYRDKSGAQRMKTCKSKKDADAYRRKVENELEAGAHIPETKGMTVGALIAEFRAYVLRRCDDGTVGRGYVDVCRHQLAYVERAIAGLKVCELTWQDVERFALDLRSTISEKNGRQLSPITVGNILSTFGTALNYGVRRGYIARNVVTLAKQEMGPVPFKAIATFDRDEVRALFQSMEQTGAGCQHRNRFQLRAMIYLAAVCGLRKGEIAGLTWGAVDFEGGRIFISQSVTQYDHVKAPKTAAGVRMVPMPQPVAATLQDYAPYVVQERRGLLFRSKSGRKLVDVGFYKMWERALERAELAPRRFHALRHFAGSAWLEAGLSLPEVSRLMGHADTAITAKIYSHAITGAAHMPAQVGDVAAYLAPPSPQLCAPRVRQEA